MSIDDNNNEPPFTKGKLSTGLRFSVDEDESGFIRVFIHDDDEGITQSFSGYDWSFSALQSALAKHRENKRKNEQKRRAS